MGAVIDNNTMTQQPPPEAQAAAPAASSHHFQIHQAAPDPGLQHQQSPYHAPYAGEKQAPQPYAAPSPSPAYGAPPPSNFFTSAHGASSISSHGVYVQPGAATAYAYTGGHHAGPAAELYREQQQYHGQMHDGCQMGVGWWLFIFGWMCPVLFLVGALLPTCDPSQKLVPSRRSAWIANNIMASISAVLFIIMMIAVNVAAQDRQLNYGLR